MLTYFSIYMVAMVIPCMYCITKTLNNTYRYLVHFGKKIKNSIVIFCLLFYHDLRLFADYYFHTELYGLKQCFTSILAVHFETETMYSTVMCKSIAFILLTVFMMLNRFSKTYILSKVV